MENHRPRGREKHVAGPGKTVYKRGDGLGQALEATLPPALAKFYQSTTQLLRDKQYRIVSAARNGAREFAQSSKVDQEELVHLAKDLGTKEGDALASALLGAVTYDRTSSSMTNAYACPSAFPSASPPPWTKRRPPSVRSAWTRAISGASSSSPACKWVARRPPAASPPPAGRAGDGGGGRPHRGRCAPGGDHPGHLPLHRCLSAVPPDPAHPQEQISSHA